jgi:hypothetical protein
MKVTPTDLADLATMVKSHDTPERRAQYIARQFPRAELVHDLDKRFRWDLLWMADGATRRAWFDRVYTYANDTHIDTALRSIVPALGG